MRAVARVRCPDRSETVGEAVFRGIATHLTGSAGDYCNAVLNALGLTYDTPLANVVALTEGQHVVESRPPEAGEYVLGEWCDDDEDYDRWVPIQHANGSDDEYPVIVRSAVQPVSARDDYPTVAEDLTFASDVPLNLNVFDPLALRLRQHADEWQKRQGVIDAAVKLRQRDTAALRALTSNSSDYAVCLALFTEAQDSLFAAVDALKTTEPGERDGES